MSAVPKSLGVLPPFVLQYDPSNAPVVQVAVSGGGLTGPQLYDYALNNIEPRARGDPRRRQRVDQRRPAAPDQRRRRSGQGAGARRHLDATSPRAVRAVERAAAVGRVHLAEVRRQRLHQRGRRSGSTTSATRSVKLSGRQAGAHPRRRARRGRRLAGDAGGRGQRPGRRLPQRAARPRRQHARDRRRGQEGGRATSRTCRRACEVKADLRPVDLRAHDLPRPARRRSSRRWSSSRSSSCSSCRACAARSSSSVAIPLSFAITLIVLYATGQTLNAFTLGGLTLAMGRLVDDAVVVLESIHRHQRMGMSAAEAALRGHQRRGAAGARLDADDDGGAAAGAAARRARARSCSRRSRSPSRSR